MTDTPNSTTPTPAERELLFAIGSHEVYREAKPRMDWRAIRDEMCGFFGVTPGVDTVAYGGRVIERGTKFNPDAAGLWPDRLQELTTDVTSALSVWVSTGSTPDVIVSSEHEARFFAWMIDAVVNRGASPSQIRGQVGTVLRLVHAATVGTPGVPKSATALDPRKA